MEIAGQHLSIPRNFLFMHRLPARFEIFVVARGAVTTKGTAFELEIAGQRLVLHSRIELKVGARYELEKVSALEFRILGEKKSDKEVHDAPSEADTTMEKSGEDAIRFLALGHQLSPHDLLALKVMEDSVSSPRRRNDKYVFDLGFEIGLKGVFVPHGPARFSLFISGHVNPEQNGGLARLMAEVGISPVRQVSEDVLERIAAGAVDIET
jgi:hypothetical protein